MRGRRARRRRKLRPVGSAHNVTSIVIHRCLFTLASISSLTGVGVRGPLLLLEVLLQARGPPPLTRNPSRVLGLSPRKSAAARVSRTVVGSDLASDASLWFGLMRRTMPANDTPRLQAIRRDYLRKTRRWKAINSSHSSASITSRLRAAWTVRRLTPRMSLRSLDIQREACPVEPLGQRPLIDLLRHQALHPPEILIGRRCLRSAASLPSSSTARCSSSSAMRSGFSLARSRSARWSNSWPMS